MNTKYPEINVPLVGEDGNAFSILGRVKRIMRRAGLEDSEWRHSTRKPLLVITTICCEP